MGTTNCDVSQKERNNSEVANFGLPTQKKNLYKTKSIHIKFEFKTLSGYTVIKSIIKTIL